ncbi:hypothetical protein [Tautonia plasticadhaerens]|nr:hypothetical protein [Tautonia plasticadhaerens]
MSRCEMFVAVILGAALGSAGCSDQGGVINETVRPPDDPDAASEGLAAPISPAADAPPAGPQSIKNQVGGGTPQ